MGLFNRVRNNGLMDAIRCDEPSYLIWKWHPSSSQEGRNSRENSIRWGSSLRVREGEVAVFVYNQGNNEMQDFIVGPFDQAIKTKNFPVLADIIGLAYNGNSPFQAEVYFINLAKIIQVGFGVPYFDIYDPRYADFGVPVAVRGTISFKIADYREFIKLHRLSTFNLADFQRQVRDAIIRYSKDVVANAPSTNDIPLVQIESKISLINDSIEYYITDRLKENFGVEVSGLDISAIEIDKSSEGYKQLMSVTKDVEIATIQAEKEAKVRNIHDMQRIEAIDYEESLRIKREEHQYALHKDIQSKNFAAYQVEAQTDVGVAGAEALGKMGMNGAGNVNLGSVGESGFNPAAMMAGLTMGGAIGQNLAATMNGAMSQINQTRITPPPIPMQKYYIAIDEKPEGPFDISQMKQLAKVGTLNKNSWVWKEGMPEWVSAESVPDIRTIFSDRAEMPPIPTTV
ncbi:protein of unknown function [Lachnospiraceae bacterium KH1T2]|nr:protein of unknown function [Lachnospiraceae bacterium KH1T2]